MSIRTQPGSNCTIKAVYNNVDSTDPGLAPGVADEFGTLSWSWKIGENVPTGTWPVTVTCLYHGRSAVVQGDLVVIPKGHVS